MNAGNCGGLEALVERYTEISGFGRFERPKKRAQEGPLVAPLARNGTKRGEIERNNLLGETAVTSDFGEEWRCKKLNFYFLPN